MLLADAVAVAWSMLHDVDIVRRVGARPRTVVNHPHAAWYRPSWRERIKVDCFLMLPTSRSRLSLPWSAPSFLGQTGRLPASC
jgi:hypothetical protein